MTKYFFHLHNSVSVFDDFGRECVSLDEARIHATRNARAIMAEDIKEIGRITLSHSISIHTEDQEEACVVRFSECVEVRY